MCLLFGRQLQSEFSNFIQLLCTFEMGNCFKLQLFSNGIFVSNQKLRKSHIFSSPFPIITKRFIHGKEKITWRCAILKRTNELLLCYLLTISFEKHFLFSLNMIFLVILLVSVIFVWNNLSSEFSMGSDSIIFFLLN